MSKCPVCEGERHNQFIDCDICSITIEKFNVLHKEQVAIKASEKEVIKLKRELKWLGKYKRMREDQELRKSDLKKQKQSLVEQISELRKECDSLLHGEK
jgi:hypothetical protein